MYRGGDAYSTRERRPGSKGPGNGTVVQHSTLAAKEGVGEELGAAVGRVVDGRNLRARPLEGSFDRCGFQRT